MPLIVCKLSNCDDCWILYSAESCCWFGLTYCSRGVSFQSVCTETKCQSFCSLTKIDSSALITNHHLVTRLFVVASELSLVVLYFLFTLNSVVGTLASPEITFSTALTVVVFSVPHILLAPATLCLGCSHCGLILFSCLQERVVLNIDL